MINEAEIKLNNSRSRGLDKPSSTSDPFKSQADTDYSKKKAAERKAIIEQINRVALNQTL